MSLQAKCLQDLENWLSNDARMVDGMPDFCLRNQENRGNQGNQEVRLAITWMKAQGIVYTPGKAILADGTVIEMSMADHFAFLNNQNKTVTWRQQMSFLQAKL